MYLSLHASRGTRKDSLQPSIHLALFDCTASLLGQYYFSFLLNNSSSSRAVRTKAELQPFLPEIKPSHWSNGIRGRDDLIDLSQPVLPLALRWYRYDIFVLWAKDYVQFSSHNPWKTASVQDVLNPASVHNVSISANIMSWCIQTTGRRNMLQCHCHLRQHNCI